MPLAFVITRLVLAAGTYQNHVWLFEAQLDLVLGRSRACIHNLEGGRLHVMRLRTMPCAIISCVIEAYAGNGERGASLEKTMDCLYSFAASLLSSSGIVFHAINGAYHRTKLCGGPSPWALHGVGQLLEELQPALNSAILVCAVTRAMSKDVCDLSKNEK